MNKYVLKDMIEKTIERMKKRREDLECDRKFQTMDIEVKKVYYKLYNYLLENYYDLLRDIDNCKETVYIYSDIYDRMEKVEDAYFDYVQSIKKMYLK